MIMVCRECYIKREGCFPFMFEEAETEDICFLCGKKKRMVKMKGESEEEVKLPDGWLFLR